MIVGARRPSGIVCLYKSWSTTADLTEVVQSQNDNSIGTVFIIIIMIILLGVLVGIILTRESSESRT